jgi:hypothetical protein
MGKGNLIKAKRKVNGSGTGFLSHAREVLTGNFQKEIRNSEFWPMVVAEFGEKKAEELLKQCKGELRPGLPPDEARDSSTDI